VKNDASPSMFPVLNPYGHIALQARPPAVSAPGIDYGLIVCM